MGDEVIDPLEEPGYLTADQRKVVEAASDIVLTACPGSGKTRTAAARFVLRAATGDRVAATSYTNVGVDELRHVITTEIGRVVGAGHFVGTLHGFLLQFVFRPFGHLVMNTSAAPRLVDAEAVPGDVVLHGNNGLRAALAGFRFRPDGSVLFTQGKKPKQMNREAVTAAGQAAAVRLKMQVARSGRATYDDTMFWVLQVLRRFPAVAAAVAGRFDELVVDEAQDISELQLACLAELCSTGRLRSVVLVGDIEQSIYSFQGASPQGLADLVSHRGLTPMSLVENHRSAQHLCNAAAHFCSRDEPDRAVGEYTDRPERPEILFYPPAEPHFGRRGLPTPAGRPRHRRGPCCGARPQQGSGRRTQRCSRLRKVRRPAPRTRPGGPGASCDDPDAPAVTDRRKHRQQDSVGTGRSGRSRPRPATRAPFGRDAPPDRGAATRPHPRRVDQGLRARTA